MNPLCKWLLIIVAVLFALFSYGCGDRPVQVGVSSSRSA